MSKKIVYLAIGVLAVLLFSLVSLTAIADPQYATATNGLKFLSVLTVLTGVIFVWGPIKESADAQDFKMGEALRERAFQKLKAKADKFAENQLVATLYVWFLARLILVVSLVSTGAVWFAVLVTFVSFLRLGVGKMLFKVAQPGTDKDNFRTS